eukprot:TRINITY_DN59000_c0_g1_i1.p1 TRINITY_DN59000_c0_g1~~TRINITY_DN59000_c0_g1_i1.p1  ORF type:complete len:378 (+),score=44.62 TRINITY_DN59000_c0_g1_i1:74-1207(+)
MVVLVPDDVLRSTPSHEDGIRRSTERELRAFGAVLIQRASVLLRLTQTTCVSAAAVFQRFYFRRSFAEFDVRISAAAALLLACKLEETQRRLKDIVVVFLRLHMRSLGEDGNPTYSGRPTPAVDLAGREASEMKQAIIHTERHMLQELGFALGALLEHPHKYVLQFVKSLKRNTDFVLCELAQTAWNYLNDAARTPLCCQYQPHQIATASIFLAARKLGLKLPKSPPWWTVFDTEFEEMRRIAQIIAALYRRPPPQFVSVARKTTQQLQGSPSESLVWSPSDEGTGIAVGCSMVGQVGFRTYGSADQGLDPTRIAEMLSEEQASAEGGRQTSPTAGGSGAVEKTRSRSRSPQGEQKAERKIVTLKLGVARLGKSKSF